MIQYSCIAEVGNLTNGLLKSLCNRTCRPKHASGTQKAYVSLFRLLLWSILDLQKHVLAEACPEVFHPKCDAGCSMKAEAKATSTAFHISCLFCKENPTWLHFSPILSVSLSSLSVPLSSLIRLCQSLLSLRPFPSLSCEHNFPFSLSHEGGLSDSKVLYFV